MAKKDKTDRKSFEDMSAEREAEVKAGIEAASDRMADAQGDAMLANINRRIDGLKDRVKNTAINIGAPQQNMGKADISGNAGRVFDQGIAKGKHVMRQDLQKMSDEAASDIMAEALGNAMLANIKRRADEVYGERLDAGRATRTGAQGNAEVPRNTEAQEKMDTQVGKIMPKKDKTGIKSFEDMSAERDAGVKASLEAASDRMADAQGEAIMNNINNHIAKREIDAAEREEAERRKAKYLSDQQAAIRANQKQTEKPAAPANNEPGNSAKTEAQNNMNERVEEGRETRTEAQGNAEAQENTDKRVDAGREMRTEEQRGNASDKAGRTAPLVVHNAEERFQKNLEDVQGKLKYEPILEIIRKYQEEQQRLADNRTPEQKKKAARREKMAKIFAALGDGVAAMSNLVLTSKGAIPYQSKSMISKAVGDRYDKFSKDLENRKARYLELSEKIAKLQQGVEDSKAEDERLKAAQELAKAKFEAELYDKAWNRKFHKDEASRDQRNKDADRELKGKTLEHTIENDHANLGIRKQQADAATTNARANASRAATFARNGGGGTRYEFDGKTYGNVHAYEAAIKQKAIQLGIPLKEDYEAIDQLGYTRTSKRDKKIDQLLAEVNEKLAGYSGFGF